MMEFDLSKLRLDCLILIELNIIFDTEYSLEKFYRQAHIIRIPPHPISDIHIPLKSVKILSVKYCEKCRTRDSPEWWFREIKNYFVSSHSNNQIAIMVKTVFESGIFPWMFHRSSK